MSSTQPNLTQPHLSLDEQSFQGLLAAAFTIQEHNDRRKQARQEEARTQSVPEPESRSLCPRCGAQKTSEESDCDSCGVDELRPGERLQRNWASMWLMSQEQGLWPERSADSAGTIGRVEGAHEDVPQFFAAQPNREPVERAVTASNFLALPSAKKTGKEPTLAEAAELVRGLFDDEPALNKSSDKTHWAGVENETAEPEDIFHSTFDDTGADPELSSSPLELAASDDLHAIAAIDESSDVSNEAPSLIPRNWTDLQVTLRFHRADLYLGLAVFVALFALLWPAASAPRRRALGPWQRALISMGIAEAPAPVMHLQGDPGVQVWVDPHTALYYCPGADPYGKTADGRFSSQRDAQLDRFEPAARSVCE